MSHEGDFVGINGSRRICNVPDEHLLAILEIQRSTQNVVNASEEIVPILKEIRDGLLASATGRNHIDKETFQETLKQFHRAYGIIITALLFTLAFVITGQKLGVFQAAAGH